MNTILSSAALLLAVLALVSTARLRKRVVAMGADVNSIEQLISDINDETNTVATKLDAQAKTITDLQAQVAAGSPVTSDQLQAISDALQPISDRLKSLGADASNPIPATGSPADGSSGS